MSKYKYRLNSEKGEINLNEKVINGKKVYNQSEIDKWVVYGLSKGYIDKNNKDIIEWIRLLKDKVIDL